MIYTQKETNFFLKVEKKCDIGIGLQYAKCFIVRLSALLFSVINFSWSDNVL